MLSQWCRKSCPYSLEPDLWLKEDDMTSVPARYNFYESISLSPTDILGTRMEKHGYTKKKVSLHTSPKTVSLFASPVLSALLFFRRELKTTRTIEWRNDVL